MYLLDVHTYKLKYFPGEVPPYTILSHTWGDDEITFQDIGTVGVEQRTGYAKVDKACELASADGLDYIWIDTCCIDKTSSAELSEAINSMYRWYHEATVCYAYLSDVHAEESSISAAKDQIRQSRYFTRGWTLQEVIAPSIVIFYNAHLARNRNQVNIVRRPVRCHGDPRQIPSGARAAKCQCRTENVLGFPQKHHTG